MVGLREGNIKMVDRDERFKDAFCDLATQYYVAARLAAQARLIPVYANLFHHAIEMYLKAALVGTIPVEQMKQKPYNHDLTRIWDEFKKKEANPALASFDPTIQELHSFESIRYPDKIVEEGMVVPIVWKAQDAATSCGPRKMPPEYKIIIEDVDNLAIEVLQRIPRNPKALITTIGAAGREALAYENLHAASWL